MKSVNIFLIISIISFTNILGQSYFENLNARRDTVIKWIKNESKELHSVNVETNFDDFIFLKSLLKDKKVVGLGEFSHGTKEVFQMKHRLLEFLVQEMGFKIFAIEASPIGCQAINNYILNGVGTSREVLPKQGFWIWNTEEMIVMIEWMRAYNLKVSSMDKIEFIGIDRQSVALDDAKKNVQEFIANNRVDKVLNLEDDTLFDNKEFKSDLSVKRQKLYEVISYFVLNSTELIENSSINEYSIAFRNLQLIVKGIESGDLRLQANTNYNIRDNYMAQAVLDLLRSQNKKIVLWAHNGHISMNPDEETNGYPRPMGSTIKKYLGEFYYPIGFSTYQGTYQAKNFIPPITSIKGVATFELPPAKEGSLDWYLNQANKKISFIDFTKDHKPRAVLDFLNNEIEMYYTGAGWSSTYVVPPKNTIIPGKSFGGMIFIKETSRAELMKS